jgi:hypothetical protein
VTAPDDDPELTKLAANRAEQWGCTVAEARQRLLDEAAAEVRVISEHPPIALVSSAAIGREGTLDAGYWISRKPGETAAEYRVRRQAEDCVRRAERHEGHAARLREEAAEMLGHYPPEVVTDYQRGRADMLAELAMMPAAERAELLSRRRHPSGGGSP